MGGFTVSRKDASGNAKEVTVVKGADAKGIAPADGSPAPKQSSIMLQAEDWAHLREYRNVLQSLDGVIYKEDARVPSSEEAKHLIRLMARTADPRAAKRPADLQEALAGDQGEAPVVEGAAAVDLKLARARIADLEDALVFVVNKSKTLERQLDLSTAEATHRSVRIEQLQAALTATGKVQESASKEVACYRARCAVLECRRVCLTA